MQEIRTRFLFYIVGILSFTLGIVLTIQSHLGTSPFDALLVGLFQTVGLTPGSWEMIIGGIMVLFNAMAQRQPPEYLAILTAVITGVFIDFWLWLLGGWVHPDMVISQSFCVGSGLILVGLGIAIYLKAHFAPLPIDRMMLVVQGLTGWNVAVSRTMISIAILVLAFMFQGPIGIGTILSVIFTGTLIKWFIPFVAKMSAWVWPSQYRSE
ncbi:YczE/YyaS/YitT family protein [Salinithrix halophila]|uniref:YitT family protein n=1 Tax=Salinithrix halophila TaxID=1485204 RepID=A0ABV8JFT2_9BACL